LENWERILLGIAAVVVVLLFFPGVKRTVEQSRKGSAEDWRGVLLPLGLVVAFVLFLIAIS
jgi:hypothetical protein